MSWVIYRIVSLLDGKSYVGATSRDVTKRLSEHLDYAARPDKRRGRVSTIQRILMMQGPENFAWQVLEVCGSAELAVERERWWIRHYDSQSRSGGYNRTAGGDGILKAGKPNYTRKKKRRRR